MISIHAPRVGSDFINIGVKRCDLQFQSTLPVWGATPAPGEVAGALGISIHAPRVGSDRCGQGWRGPPWHFNPRSPCGERPARRLLPADRRADFNPRSPCGERLLGGYGSKGHRDFNPRSPCGERRRAAGCSRGGHADFNPRSPCGERRDQGGPADGLCGFQSTLPVWGATLTAQSTPCAFRFQSTLPVWGATTLDTWATQILRFQSTLPVWGATTMTTRCRRRKAFQSTLPVWGATAKMHRFFFCIFGKKGVFL